MQSSTPIRFAGDVSIDKVVIITEQGVYQDISAQVINVQVYEDLFSPFISGSLIVKDALDLVNVLPFVGEEYVELEISTPSLEAGNIKGKFYIYKMTDREILGDRSVVYQLHFISVEAITDLNKKNSRVLGGKVSDIVKQLVSDKTYGLESEKSVFVEETVSNTKFISNFWSPVKSIMYLLDNAVNVNNSPSYIFFENRDGFYFISLEKLYDAEVYQQFTVDKYTRSDLPQAGSVRNIPEDYKRISNISIPVAFDYMDRIRTGMLSSKMITYDVTKKAYWVKNYNMFERFLNQKHLNKYPINSNKSVFRNNAHQITFLKDYANFSGFGDVTNARTIQERTSLMRLAEANKIEITVPGRCDYTVGLKVSVNLNKMEPISANDGDERDKMFSGNYIIAAINHYVDREKHECHMELIKETLELNLDGK